MSRPILIGTGFYATLNSHRDKQKFLNQWLVNTWPVSQKIVIVDNSVRGLPPSPDLQIIRINYNLGHGCAPPGHVPPLAGWSMSWILPALVAYCEQMDFVYKEQDCLAFHNWLSEIKTARATTGRSSQMDCEQSLFYIAHNCILDFVNEFLAIPDPDFHLLTETKFIRMMCVPGLGFCFHDLPGGGSRPLKVDYTRPFYMQKITELEMNHLRERKLV